MLDLHVHDVDFAHVLLGVPDTIHARGCRGKSGAIDHVFATYGYADGRYALLEGSWAYHAPWPFEMAITVSARRSRKPSTRRAVRAAIPRLPVVPATSQYATQPNE